VEDGVATLVVRRLDDDLVQRLKARAARHGRSAEAEHRAILEAALKPRMTGEELWARLARAPKVDLRYGDVDETIDSPEFD
jgi:antitoxin FitA